MILLAALVLAAEPVASAQPEAAAGATTLIVDCDAHKFETVVQVMTDGKPHSSRVKLCGKIGQSDADWARTLRDAVDKVAANPKMPATVKAQIIDALNVEIAKHPVASEVKPAPMPNIAAPSLASPLASGPSLGGPVEYSSLPPLPAPKPEATTVAATAALPPLPAPRLTFRCLATSTLGAEGPCDLLERGMLVTVRADENLSGGTSLRFLRRGDARAEIDLPALRRGQSSRFGLPPELCSGVAGSRVEIQVLRPAGRSSQVVDTRGPFELRC